MTHKRSFQKTVTLLLMLCLLVGVYGGVFAAAMVDDSRYQVIYDKFVELRRTPPMKPSEVYDKYGAMNGDYYVIAMEENYLYLTGHTDVGFRELVFINDYLKDAKSLPKDLRKGLREDVVKYGLDEGLIPYDDSFYGRGTDMVGFVTPSDEQKEEHEAFKQEWEEKHGIETEPTPAPIPTATPTPVPTATPAPITETSFADVAPDAWYAEAVEGMVKSGLIKGKDDGLFHPDDIITISEWCTLLYRITYLDALTTEGPVTNGGQYYDHWAAVAISRCAYYDYTMMGLGGSAYPEGGSIYTAIAHRGEALSAVVKILEDSREWQVRNKLSNSNVGKLTEEYRNALYEVMSSYFVHDYTWDDIPDANRVQEGVEPVRVLADGFKDFGCTHYWEPSRILDAYNLGITNGVDTNGTCNPDGVMTRAQACKMLYEAGLDHCLGLYHWSTSSGLIGG